MNIFKISLLIALFFSTFAQAQTEEQFVYKWTDENGIIHYDQRPPKGIEAEKISAGKKQKSAPPPGSSASSSAEDEGEDKPKVSRSAAEQVVTKDAELCNKAKANRNILVTKPIVRQNDKVLTIDEKNEQIRQMDEIINVHC